MPAPRSSQKRKTAQDWWLARQAANAKYYSRNRESICESRRNIYKEKAKKRQETRKVVPLATKESEASPYMLLNSSKPSFTEADVESIQEPEATTITLTSPSKSTRTNLDVETKEAEASTPIALMGPCKFTHTELNIALENARKLFDEFEDFRGDSRREFWRQLWKRFRRTDDYKELEELEQDLTNTVKLMEAEVATIQKYSDNDEETLTEVSDYLKEISIWLEDLKSFNRSALWGVDALREDLREGGQIRYLVTQPLIIP